MNSIHSYDREYAASLLHYRRVEYRLPTFLADRIVGHADTDASDIDIQVKRMIRLIFNSISMKAAVA